MLKWQVKYVKLGLQNDTHAEGEHVGSFPRRSTWQRPSQP